MSAAISQKEYIKRYLSKSDDKKKRKKRKGNVNCLSKLRIVDDDIDLSSMRPVGDEELELYNLDEDAPQVAGIIDERPEELRAMDEFRTSKRWKVVSDSTSDIKITELNANSGSNNRENNVTRKKSSVHGRRGSEGAESDDSSLQRSIRDSKQHREDSDASPPRKSRATSSSKSFLEKAPALQIKSERITDSDSDISVTRKSDFRHRNGREPEVSKKQDVKQELPNRHKGSYDNSKKKHFQNNSDRSHHMFQGEDTRTKKSSSRERWKSDAKSGHKRNFMTTDYESICNGLDVKQPKISRNKHDLDRYTHCKDFSKQNQNHRSEVLSERNHSEFRRGTLLKDGKTSSNQKNDSDEDSDSDLTLPRKSRKTERGKHSSYEQKKENRKKELHERSDSDLSLPRPSKITDKEKNKKREKVKEKHWKKDTSEQSDSDLSPPRPSESRNREKQKRPEEVKKRHRKKGSSEESESDMSLPRPSKSKEKQRPEVKKRYLKKGSSEESDSDFSPPRPSKSKEKYKSQEEMKERHRKNESSEESDSDLPLPRHSKSKEKNRRQEEVKKSNRKKYSSEESDSDLSMPRPSNSIGREKLTMQEVKKRHRKRGLSEQSDSYLSPARHSEIRGREKQKKSEVNKRSRKKVSSEESDSSLSSPRLSKSKEKNKRPEDVKKRYRKKESSEESDSSLSSPQPSKSKEKHKRPEDIKKRHRKKVSSEESASDSSPSQVSKSRDRIKYNNVEEVHKKYNRKVSSDNGSDSDSSPRPSKNKDGNKHGTADERAYVNDRSKLDMSFPQPRQKDREKNSQRKAQTAFSKKKRRNSDSSGPQTPERSNRYDHSPVKGKRSNSRAYSPEEQHARQHGSCGTSSRREVRHRSNSPPRRPPHSDHKYDRTNSVRNSRSPEAGNRKLQKTLDGKRAGLQDAKLLREELKSFAERENNMFSKMSDDVSGRLAEAVQRDRKTGKKRDLDEESRQQKEKDEKDRKFKEKYSRWGKGLKQVEEQKQNVEEAMKLMAKPLARYADDEDLDKLLRNKEREGDPMLEYIRSKKSDSDSKTTAKPMYQGSYPTNRFGIPPGYRWDGVDRSNSYEKQWFEQRSAQKAREEEAYKWSTADM